MQVLPEFKQFVNFSFSSIITKKNKKGEEKKELIGLPLWRNITKNNINNRDLGLATICGEISGITVYDFDKEETYNLLIRKNPELKNCFTVKTLKGYHIYFEFDESVGTTTNASEELEGLDIRSNGSFVISPPSSYKLLNDDIFEYKFLGGRIGPIPTYLKTCLKGFKVKKELNNRVEVKKELNNQVEVKKDINNEDKIEEIRNLIGKLNKERSNDYTNWVNIGFIIYNELGKEGLKIFDEFSQLSDKYDKEEVEKKFKSFKNIESGLTIKTLKKYVKEDCIDNEFDILVNLTSGGLADYFKANYNKKFIYSNGKLYYFNSVYWKEDDKNKSYLNNFIDEIFYFELLEKFQKYEVKQLKDNENKKEIFKALQEIRKGIEKLRNFKTRESVISDICCKLTNNEIKWNEHNNIFCFDNKVYDIDLDKFITPNPLHYINLTSGYSYDIEYDIKLVDELMILINKIFPNPEVRDIYLTSISTALSGQTLEKFIIANGKGGNGKGVLNELVLGTIGNYSYVLPSNLLLGPLKTGSNPELANCNNKRFILVREPDDKYKLVCSTIKELTGGAEINARLNHSNDTKTVLKLTLVMECNEKPKLSEATEAIARRLLDIPFVSSFIDKTIYDKLGPDERENIYISDIYYKSLEFKNKFKQALFIILTRYYKVYKANNYQLVIPSIILTRNHNYMSGSDDIYNFIDEYYTKTDNKKDTIKLKEVYENFKNSDYFLNMSKEEKRKNNYKKFCENIQTNMFMKSFIKKDYDNCYNLLSYKVKENDN